MSELSENIYRHQTVDLTSLGVECCRLLDAECLTPRRLGQNIGDGDLHIVQPGRGQGEAVQLAYQVVGELLHGCVKL